MVLETLFQETQQETPITVIEKHQEYYSWGVLKVVINDKLASKNNNMAYVYYPKLLK